MPRTSDKDSDKDKDQDWSSSDWTGNSKESDHGQSDNLPGPWQQSKGPRRSCNAFVVMHLFTEQANGGEAEAQVHHPNEPEGDGGTEHS